MVAAPLACPPSVLDVPTPIEFPQLFEVIRDEIWKFLTLPDIARLSATSLSVLCICDDGDALWKNLYSRDVEANLSRHGFAPSTTIQRVEERYAVAPCERFNHHQSEQEEDPALPAPATITTAAATAVWLHPCDVDDVEKETMMNEGTQSTVAPSPTKTSYDTAAADATEEKLRPLPYVSDYKLLILDEFAQVQREKLDVMEERLRLVEEMNAFRKHLLSLLDQNNSPVVENQLRALLSVRPDRTAEIEEVKMKVRPQILGETQRLESSIRSAMLRRRQNRRRPPPLHA